MKRTKEILIIFLIIILVLFNTNISFSANNREINTYEKIIINKDGSMFINLKDLNISHGKNYKWAISKNKVLDNEVKWFEFETINITDKTAQIYLDPEDDDILRILKTTDIAYIFIKDINTNVICLNGLQVDIKLPYSTAFEVFQERNLLWQIKKLYGISKMYYSTVKITDKDVIRHFKETKKTFSEDAITLNGDTEVINNNSIDKFNFEFEIPTDWKELATPSSSFTKKDPVLPYETVPHDPALYVVWLKAKDNNSKEIYGYFLVNRISKEDLEDDISDTSKEELTTNDSDTPKEIIMENDNSSDNNSIVEVEDLTMSTKKLPQTGKKFAIISVFLAGIVLIKNLIKYCKFKDI